MIDNELVARPAVGCVQEELVHATLPKLGKLLHFRAGPEISNMKVTSTVAFEQEHHTARTMVCV